MRQSQSALALGGGAAICQIMEKKKKPNPNRRNKIHSCRFKKNAIYEIDHGIQNPNLEKNPRSERDREIDREVIETMITRRNSTGDQLNYVTETERERGKMLWFFSILFYFKNPHTFGEVSSPQKLVVVDQNKLIVITTKPLELEEISLSTTYMSSTNYA